MTAAGTGSYAFANARARQLVRLTALEELLDAGTVRHLEDLGIGAGWRCLEAGAGGGSIARWLCERVGRTGHVTATDLDTRFVEVTLLHQPNGRVVQHDVLRDELPEAAFDLVHARLLLAWLAEPSRGLARLVASLKPGGWLLAEEMDFVSIVADGGLDASLSSSLRRVVEAHNTVLEHSREFNAAFGRRLHMELELAGLTQVRAEGRVGMWRGGTAAGRVWRLTFEQMRAPIEASGLVTAGEMDRVIELCEDPCLRMMSQVTMAAWGRRPMQPPLSAARG